MRTTSQAGGDDPCNVWSAVQNAVQNAVHNWNTLEHFRQERPPSVHDLVTALSAPCSPLPFAAASTRIVSISMLPSGPKPEPLETLLPEF